MYTTKENDRATKVATGQVVYNKRRIKVEKLHLFMLVVAAVLALWAIPANAQDYGDAPVEDAAMLEPEREPEHEPVVFEDGVDAIETVASGWYRTSINGTTDRTGKGAKSIAVRSDGKTFVSYYNDTDGSLDVAMQVLPLAGNCGTDLAWVCMTVDDSNSLDIGMANAIAIYPLADLPAVVYTAGDPGNPVNHALKFAVATGCTNTGCTWNVATIQAFNFNYRSGVVDLVFSTDDNNPHIAYTATNTQVPKGVNHTALYYATIAGNGNCPGGASGWQCALIDNGGRGVIDVAIGLNANDRPRIAYSRYDMSGDSFTNSWVLFAAYSVNSGNCGPEVNGAETWTCSQLRQSSGYAPSFLDMAMNGSEPHIAFVNQVQERLIYMTLDFQDLTGNCGPGNQWHCADLEEIGIYARPSVALRAGAPLIAYTDKDDTVREILKSATPQAIGNCGPQDGLFFSWQCTQLDNGVVLNATQAVGFQPAIGFDTQRSTIEIAYGTGTTDDLLIIENHRPAPVLNSLGQNSVPMGSATIQVLIKGKNFATDAWAVKDGVYVPTERISSTQVRATIDAAVLQQIQTMQLRVCNPPFPLTDCSNSAPFQVTTPKIYLPVVTK